MSAPIPEIEISAELQQWAEPFFDYNSETYNPLAVLERIAALEAQNRALTASRDMHACLAVDLFAQRDALQAHAQQLREAGKILLDDSVPLNTGLKAIRAALAATEEKA